MSTHRNWAGNVRYAARAHHRPSSMDELRELVAGSDRIRAVGSGHSFNRLGDTTGDLVTLAGLPATVRLDEQRRLVDAPAAMRYGDLATWLHERGYAAGQPRLAAAHLGGRRGRHRHPRLRRDHRQPGHRVAGLELVTAAGELLTVDRDDADFPGMVVSLGALGIVTRLTLEVVPTFDIRQYVHLDLPRAALDEALGSAYSVSVFTDWRSTRGTQVWCKQLAEQSAPPAGWLGTTAADRPWHPVPGMPAVNCTEQLGVAGPWHERLPHFRLGFTPSSGDELQSEYHLPRAVAADALAALDEVAHLIAPVSQTSELRTVAADGLWLSPNQGRDTLAVHFTWIADASAVLPVVAEVERTLAPFAPRPHWGKVFTTPTEAIAATYPHWPDFAALLHRLDPQAKFHTETLNHLFPR